MGERSRTTGGWGNTQTEAQNEPGAQPYAVPGQLALASAQATRAWRDLCTACYVKTKTRLYTKTHAHSQLARATLPKAKKSEDSELQRLARVDTGLSI
eukprot:scaffold69874_cov33-Tisochrysis_lutea.AAC.1